MTWGRPAQFGPGAEVSPLSFRQSGERLAGVTVMVTRGGRPFAFGRRKGDKEDEGTR